jgi:prepilin-type N-terminal cleavage/methylation domain-containing protein
MSRKLSTQITACSEGASRHECMAPGGFTLVELLFAMTILTVIVVLMSQMVNTTAQATRSSGKRQDADSQARLVFDRMAGDLAQMLRRPDADTLFFKNTGNDVLYFYSESPAYFTNTIPSTNKNTISLIGYRINSNNPLYPNTPVLERLGKGLQWTDASSSNTPIFLTISPGSAVPTNQSTLAGNWSNTLGTLDGGYTDGSDPAFQVIGELVYRMEIQFLLTDGTISDYPILTNTPANWPTSVNFYTSTGTDPTSSRGTPSYTTGSRWFNTTSQRGYICISAVSNSAIWTPIGTRDISSIVVTLGILDSNSRKIISPSASISGSPLTDSTNGTYIGSAWMNQVTNSTFATSTGIPQAAASQVRIFQRCFPLQ